MLCSVYGKQGTDLSQNFLSKSKTVNVMKIKYDVVSRQNLFSTETKTPNNYGNCLILIGFFVWFLNFEDYSSLAQI